MRIDEQITNIIP